MCRLERIATSTQDRHLAGVNAPLPIENETPGSIVRPRQYIICVKHKHYEQCILHSQAGADFRPFAGANKE